MQAPNIFIVSLLERATISPIDYRLSFDGSLGRQRVIREESGVRWERYLKLAAAADGAPQFGQPDSHALAVPERPFAA